MFRYELWIYEYVNIVIEEVVKIKDSRVHYKRDDVCNGASKRQFYYRSLIESDATGGTGIRMRLQKIKGVDSRDKAKHSERNGQQ